MLFKKKDEVNKTDKKRPLVFALLISLKFVEAINFLSKVGINNRNKWSAFRHKLE